MFSESLQNSCEIQFVSKKECEERIKKDPQLANWLSYKNFSLKEGSFVEVLGEDYSYNYVLAVYPSPENRAFGFFDMGARMASSLKQGAFRWIGNITEKDEELFSLGWGLSLYHFHEFKTEQKEKSIPELQTALAKKCQSIVDSSFLVRDLINTPASHMGPEELELCIRQIAEEHGAEVNVTKGHALLTENFPSIHAVGRASVHEPRLIELYWGDKKAPKISLVGKGVCFDSGGYDLKPGSGMRKMKKDMGGAAIAIGLANLIMSQKLNVQIQLLIPAVENLVSGNAFKPGDVLETRKGLKVEIDNTDAEGRLVLSDALTKACEWKPSALVDFATLTGACRVALGQDLPGLFSNDQDLAFEIQKLSFEEADPFWSLPLYKPYMKQLSSDIADCSNSSSSGFAGAITAALYLSQFVEKEIPWVHLDVYGWTDDQRPHCPRGGEALGLRTMYEWIRKTYTETK